jgi:hypothetical protein
MDSVGIAFELMRFELEAEVESLNSDGAKHFRESQYDLADALTKKGKALQDFSERVKKLEEEWEASFASGVDEQDEANVTLAARKILSGSKSSKTALLVRFPDGEVISEKTAAGTLVKFIQKVGIESVANLDIVVNSENIVSKSSSKRGYNETSITPFFIKTHSSTAQKKRNIEDIAKALDLSCEIIIV